MTFIDLTHTFTTSMPVFPGDDEVRLWQYRWIDRDAYNDHRLETGMHVGTHIDAPAHMIAGGQGIAQFPPGHFAGRGVLLDVRSQADIQLEDSFEERIHKNDIVFFLTGHTEMFGQAEYFESYPTLSYQLAELLVRTGVRLVGFDSPSPDRYPFNVHTLLLGANILIIENLTNLEALLGIEAFEVYAFPLKIQANASPVRVVAKIF